VEKQTSQQLKMALYGTCQPTLLLWKLLSKTLVELGFKLKKYDPCVTNKTIIIKKVVENLIRDLNKTFGQESLLTKTMEKY